MAVRKRGIIFLFASERGGCTEKGDSLRKGGSSNPRGSIFGFLNPFTVAKKNILQMHNTILKRVISKCKNDKL